MIESVTGALKAGDSVVLVGFGTLVVKERAARTGRNLANWQADQDRRCQDPGLCAGKALKDAVTCCLLDLDLPRSAKAGLAAER